MGLGGEDEEDTAKRLLLMERFPMKKSLGGLVAVMRQDAFNHRDLRPLMVVVPMECLLCYGCKYGL